MNHKLLALFGLKFNPFTPEVPTEALYVSQKIKEFCWRIEHVFIRDGGFAMIHGDSGTGKSVVLRILLEHLSGIRDVQVGILSRPTASLGDFYRELGDIFGVSLNIFNRWHGFKGLRERWQKHVESALVRPILLIDEAQEMPIKVLNELRLLCSQQFDSRLLLSVILSGDKRLKDKLRHDDLIPLGSRIRLRMQTEYASPEQLYESLEHLISQAGNPQLMTKELMKALCDHAYGNYRVLTTMADELLAQACNQDCKQLDEKLFLTAFAPKPSQNRKPT